jgi:hypothetical protein
VHRAEIASAKRERKLLSGRRDFLNNAHALVRREMDDPVRDCEQAVVFGALDVAASGEFGAALPDDDASSRHELTSVGLDAQALWIRIAAVARRTLTFLMCHIAVSLFCVYFIQNSNCRNRREKRKGRYDLRLRRKVSGSTGDASHNPHGRKLAVGKQT